MRNVFTLLLTFVLCLSLCACNSENNAPQVTDAPTEATVAPTEAEVTIPATEETIPPTAEPTEESVEEALYTPFIGKWECSDGYYVIVNGDGTIVYNDAEYIPEYLTYADGVAAVVYDAPYTYANGTQTSTGCVFVWGLTERFGEGVMIGDHDGRHFILQTE
jgi:hypothetical protein